MLKMEYKCVTSTSEPFKFARGDKVWFTHDEDKFGGIIKDVYYNIVVQTVDKRTKTCLGLGKQRSIEGLRINLRDQVPKQVGTYMMIDITSHILGIDEIIAHITGHQWEWDQTVVLGKVISCTPSYTILGQYRDNEPTLEELDNDNKGEQYGGIDEDNVSFRNIRNIVSSRNVEQSLTASEDNDSEQSSIALPKDDEKVTKQEYVDNSELSLEITASEEAQ